MARIFRKEDRFNLVIDELKPKDCPDCEGKGCGACEYTGQVAGEKVGEIRFLLSPLSIEQKTELNGFNRIEGGKLITDDVGMTKACFSMVIKGVSGLFVDSEGKVPYQLVFNPNADKQGRLTDECVSDLLNIQVGPELAMGCLSLIKGIPTGKIAVPNRSPIRYEFDESPNPHSPGK